MGTIGVGVGVVACALILPLALLGLLELLLELLLLLLEHGRDVVERNLAQGVDLLGGFLLAAAVHLVVVASR
jgi:hypothetical protein